MDKIKKLLYEMRLELKNVKFPNKKELWGSTWVVIIASILLAIFVGLIDILFSQLIGRILR